MSAIFPLNALLIEAFEAALNAYLRLDPASVERLGAFSGKVIALRLRGLETTVYLLPHNAGVAALGHYAGDPDTTLEGTPMALAQLSLGDSARALFSGDVTIGGDVELGQRFKSALDAMDIDWEEHLSKYVGDALAYRTRRALGAARQWGADAATSLGRDIGEYLQFEAEAIASRFELEQWLDDIDGLRCDVDRLEARVHRLREWGGARGHLHDQ